MLPTMGKDDGILAFLSQPSYLVCHQGTGSQSQPLYVVIACMSLLSISAISCFLSGQGPLNVHQLMMSRNGNGRSFKDQSRSCMGKQWQTHVHMFLVLMIVLLATFPRKSTVSIKLRSGSTISLVLPPHYCKEYYRMLIGNTFASWCLQCE
jgi:hypothetical protein